MMKYGRGLVLIGVLVTVASAQQIQVRMNSRISSASTAPGTPFEGVLMNPVTLSGQSCAKGAPVGGVVSEAKKSGRLSSPGVLQLQPTWVSCHGRRVNVVADPVVLEGRSHTKNNAVLIGGGAGAGAILGGIMGGGKGAAIGAAVGAGAGTVGAAASGKREAVIEPEAVVGWNVQPGGNNGYSRDDRGGDRGARGNSYRHEDHARRHDDDDDDDRDGDRRDDRYRDVRFTDHERAYLSRCLASNYRLPPGLAKQGKIPPGHAKKMAQAGQIPYACTSELSPIPSGWERVILDARVILYDATHRERDSFMWRHDD